MLMILALLDSWKSEIFLWLFLTFLKQTKFSTCYPLGRMTSLTILLLCLKGCQLYPPYGLTCAKMWKSQYCQVEILRNFMVLIIGQFGRFLKGVISRQSLIMSEQSDRFLSGEYLYWFKHVHHGIWYFQSYSPWYSGSSGLVNTADCFIFLTFSFLSISARNMKGLFI